MTLSNLKKLARLMIPGAKSSKITSGILELLLNKGAEDVASLGILLPVDETFNVTSGTSTYNLSNLVTRFLTMDKPGLWWNNGTNWKRVKRRTEKWLDTKVSNWRDMDNGSPLYYFIKSGKITVIPTPDTTLSDGFKIYFGQKPPTMSASGHFPFGGSSEISHLTIFDIAIVKFVAWNILPMLGRRDDYRMAENEYKREVGEKIAILRRSRDLDNISPVRYSGRRVC